ncbi:MAG: PAS domain S-box protein [Bacteroidales bacterium]|jgi:PAS domain S-box-containing protein|nr:PAS domain S-box protein [Bacteroidales bacterium]
MKEYRDIENRINEKENDLILLSQNMINAFVLFHSVFDDKGDFISYRFVYINDAYEKITGVKNKDVKGKTVHEVWPETEPEWIEKYGNVATTGISNSFEMYHKATQKLYNCNVYRSFDNNERFCVIFEDITERKKNETEVEKAKQKAEESEIKFKNYFKYAPDGVFITDEKGNYIEVNQAASKITGYSKNELCKMNLIDLIPDKDRSVAIKHFSKVLDKGHFSGELLFQKKDKTNGFWIVDAVRLSETRFLGFAKEITERKKQEYEILKAKEKAEESEKQLKLIIDNIPVNIARFDKDMKYLFATKQYCNQFDLFPNEIIGKSLNEVLNKDAFKRAMPFLQDVINGKVVSFENYIHNKKGKTEYHQLNYIPEINNNDVSGFYVFGYDVTQRKEYETNLKQAKEKAEESDRLKTAFLQNMSHEIRTPLNAISGFSGILNKPEFSEEKRSSFISIIQNSSEQLISIISDILTISSLETKQEKICNDKVCVNNIIIDLLSIFKPQAHNQNISLYAKQQLSDNQAEIYTDKTKITQILSNLISNALKFTHEGFIEFGYKLKEHELEFYVKDSGIGIKPEFHEEIFGRFHQATSSINKLYGGTGLGLSISKGFTDLLGGKIWVQSELEKGSTFYFTIPYKPVNEIDKTISPIIQSGKFRTVLVAEDEEFNFLYIEALLIRMNLKLIHAKDGKETVEIFKANTNIDLILMDIKMPIMNGHEAAKIIKELNPDFPIIAQSAYALEHEIEKYSGVFDDYLTKPIKENDLKQKVMKYIEKQ